MTVKEIIEELMGALDECLESNDNYIIQMARAMRRRMKEQIKAAEDRGDL